MLTEVTFYNSFILNLVTSLLCLFLTPKDLNTSGFVMAACLAVTCLGANDSHL